MRILLRVAVLAMLGAVAITVWTRPKPLDEQLLQLQVAQSAPQYAGQLATQPAEIRAVFLTYDDDPVLLSKAWLALTRYPDISAPVFLNFGLHPTFKDVLRRYGEDVMLPIHYFLTHEIFTLEVMRSMSETARLVLDTLNAWTGDEAAARGRLGGPLSSAERGWYAIQFLDAEGYGFMDQFVVTAGGQIAWLQTERFLDAVNRFFASGFTNLETRWRRDHSVGLSDVGWAAVDLAVGVGAFKVLRMGKAGAGAKAMTLSQRSAVIGAGLWRGSVVGTRLVKYGAPAILAYMAVRHPSVVNSLLGTVAHQLGLPIPLVQWLGWTLILFPLLFMLRFALAPVAWLLMLGARLLQRGHKALGVA